MVTQVTPPISQPVLQLSTQPNPDWQIALTYLQTKLTEDLFQKIQSASEISVFVRDFFCHYPQFGAQALNWHLKYADGDTWRELPAEFDAFFAENLSANEFEIMRALRIFRRSHSAAIAVLELTDHLAIESTSMRISAVADQMIKVAYRWCKHSLEQRFGVPTYSPDEKQSKEQDMLILAMGKLGGYELNFSSDIDLIFSIPGEVQLTAGHAQLNPVVFSRNWQHS